MKFSIDIEKCLEVLHAGGLILYPTDTLWAIGCDAGNEHAVAKIYDLKGRNEDNNMIVLLADESDIPVYTRQQNLTIYDYIKGIHKPVSVIYRDAVNLAPNLLNRDNSIGIRVVKDEFCQSLIRAFGKPVVSASSNVSGYPPPRLFADIDNKIKDGVDYVVRHRQEDDEPGEPSTVIKLLDNGSYEVVRP